MKPGPEQKARALAAAETMREAGDADGMAHYLLWMHDRNQHLEALYDAVKHYLHSGRATHEHAVLVRTMEKVEDALWKQDHTDTPSVFGSDS